MCSPRSTRLRHALLVAGWLLSAPLAARAQNLVLTGTVFDSLAGAPLVGALVQLVPDSGRATRVLSATSDSAGRYRIEGVGPGVYIAGFFAPAVDRLGLELRPLRLTVEGGGPTSERIVDFAIPSARTVLATLCPASARGDSTGMLLGHVYDADSHQPRPGAVTVLWYEITISERGINQSRRQYPSKTDDEGWYALCGLPAGTTLTASAAAGGEESGVIEVSVPVQGVLMRDFLVSHADSTITVYADSSAPVEKRERVATLRRGTARLTGVVRSDKGAPVANAEVSVPGTGLTARTAREGSYAIGALPSGTWTIDVRALGFEPKRVVVDLAAGTTTTTDIMLGRHVPTLDVVQIYGKRSSGLAAFERRRRSGMGRMITRGDIERRHPIRATDALRMTPSVHVLPGGAFGNVVRMRGGCRPSVYLNNMPMPADAADDIDSVVNPEEITAIEVYNTITPGEFQSNGCGALVIWAGMLPR